MSGERESLRVRIARRLRRVAVGCADLRERYLGKTPRVGRPQRVVFVCRGNICRSPFAEFRVRQLVPDLETVSAGVHVSRSHPPPDAAVTAARTFDLDVAAHRSRSILTIEDDPQTLYLVFEPWQAKVPALAVPARSGRVFNLSAWAEPRRSTIPDPYGGDPTRFLGCFEMIDRALGRLVSGWEPS